MAFQDFPRWTIASVAKHIHAQSALDSIAVVVELVNTRTPTWESSSSNVEITIDGPRLAKTNRNSYRAAADVFAIVSTKDNGTTYGNDHITVVGKVAAWINSCIEVYNLGNESGDDGLTLIGTLKPNNGDAGVIPVNLKPTRTDDRLHSTISGTFKARYTV